MCLLSWYKQGAMAPPAAKRQETTVPIWRQKANMAYIAAGDGRWASGGRFTGGAWTSDGRWAGAGDGQEAHGRRLSRTGARGRGGRWAGGALAPIVQDRGEGQWRAIDRRGMDGRWAMGIWRSIDRRGHGRAMGEGQWRAIGRGDGRAMGEGKMGRPSGRLTRRDSASPLHHSPSVPSPG